MNRLSRKSLVSSARMYPKQTALFTGVAVFLMVFVHVFVLGSFDEFGREGRSLSVVPDASDVSVVSDMPVGREGDLAFEGRSEPDLGAGIEVEPYIYPLFAEYYPYDDSAEDEMKVAIPFVKGAAGEERLDAAYQYSLKNPNAEKVRIAIVIDDVGMNRTQSRVVIEMDDVPLTLAFLPYAPDLSALTEPAQAAGHELMIHMPMEPVSSKVPLGPIAIRDHMGADEIKAMLEAAYASFDGYTGLNNHMGSLATQNKAAMDVVMDSLDARGLFYVDSKTINTSVAAEAAREQGIAHATRDIFLDHEETLEFARGALERLEKVALEKGHGIAIGHPKEHTIAALKEWIPTLEARGFEIVPVSALLMHPSEGDVLVAKAEIPKKLRGEVEEEARADAGADSGADSGEGRSVSVPQFVLDAPVPMDDIAGIEPAAGDFGAGVDIDGGVEALLRAPIGVSDDDAAEGISSGLYSLSAD